jgi:hypothetical protein
MDRDKLICAHFDAHIDLQWVTDLEPKFKAAQWDAAEIEEFREAWKGHTETRDWDWWLDKVKGMSNSELQRETAECHTQIETFRNRSETDRERFRRIIDGKDTKQPTQQETKSRGREM